MPEKATPREFVHLLSELQHRQEAQRISVEGAGLNPQLALLRQWQSERLANTYADLLANEQYRLACQFFLNDIYAARDFSQRNYDAEHLYNLFSRFLPAAMLALLADAIRLNQLSSRLDHALLQALVEDPGMTERITPQMYAQAYRICNNYAERQEQIDLIVKVLTEAAVGARNPLFPVSLRLVRAPALRAGWSEVYGFLERGYLACKPMKDVKGFVKTIQMRELALLEQIFAGDPGPLTQEHTSY